MKGKGVSSLKVVIFLSLIIGAYLLFDNYRQPIIDYLIKSSPLSKFFEFQTPTTFYNTRYNYYIAYPKTFTLGFYDLVEGTVKEVKGFEPRLGVYQDSKNPFKNFLEIQAFNKSDKTAKELAEENTKKNASLSQNRSFSTLTTIKIQDKEGYAYTFTGQALSTSQWDSQITQDKYKVVFVEKDGSIFSIYFTDNEDFNRIFNSFTLN